MASEGLETTMNSLRPLAAVVLIALACPAWSYEGDSGDTPVTEKRNTSASSGTGVKGAARDVGRSIKSGARQLKAGVKDGARQFKHSVAVARCNDGEYSYTHHTTCNHHGGVREQLR
jgi:hypothetical protein